MPAELSMNGRKKIETIQKEFTNKFNYLTLLFLDENRKSLDISRSLAEVRTVKGTDVSINAGLKVNTLEARFMQNYGLLVEVAYLKDGKVMHTKDNVDKTLNEMNRWCEENGCEKFGFKKSKTGETVLSLQEQLFNAISEQYPDAVAKKMNKDNFMDVHLPAVNSKKGTHIFFNTAKEGIKFGFYCRDEEFVKSVLDKSSNIEQYAQGLRPAGNPLFTNVEEAAEAALDFIREMMGELDQNEVTNDDNDEKNDSGNNSIKLNTENVSQLLQEIKNNKNQKSFEIICYTKEYSDMTFDLNFKVKDSNIAVNRVNWYNDSYWKAEIDKKQLIEALENYLENEDKDELIENNFYPGVIDYEFDEPGKLDNGFDYNLIEIEPELDNIPDELQDENGDLDMMKLANDQWPENEELSDKNIGTVYSYQIIIEDKIYELRVFGSDNAKWSNEPEERIKLLFESLLTVLIPFYNRGQNEEEVMFLMVEFERIVTEKIILDNQELLNKIRNAVVDEFNDAEEKEWIKRYKTSFKLLCKQFDLEADLKESLKRLSCIKETESGEFDFSVLENLNIPLPNESELKEKNIDESDTELSADEEMQRFLDNLEIDDSDDDNEEDQPDSTDEDEKDDLENLVIKELPSKKSGTKLFKVNGKYTFTLGYDTKAYVNEDVIGIVSDDCFMEALNSGDGWSNYIWDNNWHELDNKLHNHGIIEPASHLELPSGEKVEIKLNYSGPEFDKQKIAFNNSSGKFVHISSSAEKAYGWDGWKKYFINFGPGVFDTSKIEVSFDDDIVSGYSYEMSKDETVDFTEDDGYETSGIGFSSELYFNNGKELVVIDLDELSGELEEKNISKDDIKSIKRYLMTK